MNRNMLSFEIRVKPLSPVHIGIGNEFVGRGAYHLYQEGRQDQLALLQPRRLAGRLLDHFGDQGQIAAKVQDFMERDAYPVAIARDIESGAMATRRMSVHPGALPFLRATDRNGGLKVITAQANGLPYIPGSSVKGALRTAWLDWQTQQKGAYDRFRGEVQQANLRGRDRADDPMMDRKQIAEGLSGTGGRMQPQNRDLFRAVQVSDLLPDRTQNLTKVYAVLSMSYQAGSHARPSNGGKAGAQALECLNPDAGASYTGTVTVDLDLLRRMQVSDPDARNLAQALARQVDWTDALAGYGERFYGTEEQHYNMLGDLDRQGQDGIQLWGEGGLVLDWVMAETQEKGAPQLFPLGMGTGLLAHSVLGALPPESSDLAFLGDEPGREDTLLKGVLDTGLRRPNSAYAEPDFPSPKSRRVTGTFNARTPRDMRAERPLGWTELTLKVRGN